jgi:hypothetical protein
MGIIMAPGTAAEKPLQGLPQVQVRVPPLYDLDSYNSIVAIPAVFSKKKTADDAAKQPTHGFGEGRHGMVYSGVFSIVTTKIILTMEEQYAVPPLVLTLQQLVLGSTPSTLLRIYLRVTNGVQPLPNLQFLKLLDCIFCMYEVRCCFRESKGTPC